jgi:antitoxin CptB
MGRDFTTARGARNPGGDACVDVGFRRAVTLQQFSRLRWRIRTEAGRTCPGLASARARAYITLMTALSEIELRRKKALFRAQRRGFRELDLIFGAFADAHLARLGEAELERFEALLALPDWQIYDWIMGASPVPAAYNHDVFARLCAYRPNLGR